MTEKPSKKRKPLLGKSSRSFRKTNIVCFIVNILKFKKAVKCLDGVLSTLNQAAVSEKRMSRKSINQINTLVK